MKRTLFGSAALSLALAGGAVAQDPTGPARVRLQIAEQKLASDVTYSLDLARRLARIDPARAGTALTQALEKVQRADEVTPDVRAAQERRVREQYAALNLPTLPAAPAAPVAAPPAVRAESTEVARTVAEIAKLYDGNRFAEAQANITALKVKYPLNPAVLALEGQGMLAERVGEATRLAREQADRNRLALVAVDRSALPAKGDIEFPADFQEKMARRDALSGEQLDPEVEAILAALEKPVPATLTGGPFREVIQSLSNLIDKKMIVDERAFADEERSAGKTIDVPTGVSARTALRAVTQAQGMTFVVKENYIHIVTIEEARRSCVKRAYYIGDVLAGPLSGGATFGPVADFYQTSQVALMIIDNIKKSIDPTIWESNGQGGIATVSFHAPSMNLIVSAPAEVHASVAKSMKPRGGK